MLNPGIMTVLEVKISLNGYSIYEVAPLNQ